MDSVATLREELEEVRSEIARSPKGRTFIEVYDLDHRPDTVRMLDGWRGEVMAHAKVEKEKLPFTIEESRKPKFLPKQIDIGTYFGEGKLGIRNVRLTNVQEDYRGFFLLTFVVPGLFQQTECPIKDKYERLLDKERELMRQLEDCPDG